MTVSNIARCAALAAGSLVLAATGAAAQEGAFMKDFLGSIGLSKDMFADLFEGEDPALAIATDLAELLRRF